ncbi:GAF domain-containing protein [Polaromonas sp.]|uniref:GAF domain-containing protein n=1 Tax=Polaromonas sp. TaxID=1869339 RepID=UPI002BE371EF|nr:GAF domain-containing protein [Polaromonas sp.]HQS30308.1 GAF domain-containing protein [Polaromonas sp.]HQS89671.1 GAF domain-containing protein [Polaromonas sp.]
MIKDSSSLSNFQQVLHKHGLRAGLVFLNERVPHRYTSVYQLSQQRLRRLGFVDKLGGQGLELAELPFKDSFCEISVREGHFVTTEAINDDRLTGNPYQRMVGSYVGLPLVSASHGLFGTFCHYDERGHPVNDTEFVFLQQSVRILAVFVFSNRVAAEYGSLEGLG